MDSWSHVLLDGLVGATVGALAGGLVSLFVALLVVRRTQEIERQRSRDDEALRSASALSEVLLRVFEEMIAVESSDVPLPDIVRTRQRRTSQRNWAAALALHGPALPSEVIGPLAQTAATYGAYELWATSIQRQSGGEFPTVEQDPVAQMGELLVSALGLLAAYRRGTPLPTLPAPEMPPPPPGFYDS